MPMTGSRGLALVPAAVFVVAFAAAAAAAQTTGAPAARVDLSHLHFDVAAPDPQRADPRPARVPAKAAPRTLAWTIELHGGEFGTFAPARGVGALPAGGSDFVTANDVVSPEASSWFFGRGAAWLNVFAKPVSSLQTAPIDAVLTSASALHQRGPAFGVRVTREITQRLDLEVVVDRSATQFMLAPGVLSSLQTATSTYQNVWETLLSGLPHSSATAALSGTDTFGHQTFATAAGDYFISFGRITPFLALGGGAVANTGSVDAAFSGDLQFQVSAFAEHQTDDVTVVFGERRWSPAAVIGTGLVAQLSRRIGVRLDLRSYLVGNGLRTSVSATPGMPSGSGVTDLVNPNGVAIQFNPAGAPASTLGVPLADATTFTGTGWHKQLAASFGCFFRF
jgi:hypothetical protein